MTASGIPRAAWERIQEFCVDIANATGIGDDVMADHHSQRLFDLLDELEQEYGRDTALLTTRADFTDSCEEALALLEEALDNTGDPTERGYALQSIVRLNIEDRQDAFAAEESLNELEPILLKSSDRSDRDELEELQRALSALKRELAQQGAEVKRGERRE